MTEPPRLKACVDRIPAPRYAADRLAFSRDRKWNVDVLHVRFLSGDILLQHRVRDVVREWNAALQDSIHFVFDDAGQADIRVSFDDCGNWSYIGTDTRRYPQDVQTLNLGSVGPGADEATLRQVVLHEFGHALGCVHEFLAAGPRAPALKQIAVIQGEAGLPQIGAVG